LEIATTTTARRDLWDNPMGTDGFEFIEYTRPDPQALGALFERMGFIAGARHRSKNVTLYKQGAVNFILNAEPTERLLDRHFDHSLFNFRRRPVLQHRLASTDGHARHAGGDSTLKLRRHGYGGIGAKSSAALHCKGARSTAARIVLRPEAEPLASMPSTP
jgi:hypothetical protein